MTAVCTRALALTLLLVPAAAWAQSTDIATEVDVTIGQSTDDVRAAGTQARIDKVVIRWPSGKVQTLTAPQMGQIHRLKEPA